MKAIKPQRIALLYRPYEYLGQFHFAVTGILYFPFVQPDYLLPEIAMWKLVAQELGKDAVLDIGMPKPRGETLVWGKCFAPGGRPATRSSVRLIFGDPARPAIDKSLAVFGDRIWTDSFGMRKIGDPAPFVSMPIDYLHAFGGVDHPLNPVGKGAAPLAADAHGIVVHPLPNVEDPLHPIVSSDDTPSPASLAPLDFTWPQRSQKAGTYDETWLKERFPGLPDDIDMAIFNAAPDDQRLSGFMDGSERFELHGMHPERSSVGGSLPAAAVRCLVNQRTDRGLVLREVPMRAETLWLFPQAERAALIFRGDITIASDDAEDIEHLLIAAESLAAPRSSDYYQDILAQRLDPVNGALLALSDEQLLPPLPLRSAPLADDGGGEDALFTPKGLQRARMLKIRDKMLDDAKAELHTVRAQLVATQQQMSGKLAHPALHGRPEAAGREVPTLDLAAIDAALAMSFPPDPPPPTLEELPALRKKLIEDAKRIEAEGQQRIAEAEHQVRAALTRANGAIEQGRARALQAGAKPEQLAAVPKQPLDYDKLVAEARKQVGGPPKPMAPDTLAQLRDAGARAHAGIDRLHDLKIRAAADAGATIEAATATAEPALKAATARQLIDENLTRRMPAIETMLVDADRRMLEGYRANAHMFPPAQPMTAEASAAARARVSAAGVARQSLAGVDFTGADFSGLNLKGMDFSSALLEGVDFSDADLEGATLAGAVLARARLVRARLVRIDLSAANLGFADLSGADGRDANLAGANLSNARLCAGNFSGARFDAAVLLGVRLAGADLSRANLPEAQFLEVDLSPDQKPPPFDFVPGPAPELELGGVKFAGANLQKALFIHCRVAGCDFEAANLSEALFLGARGDGCRFVGANMTNTRFVSACSFAGSDFSRARMDMANARGSNLADGVFTGCSLVRADFSECNIRLGKFAGANARGARFAKTDLTRADLGGVNLHEGFLQKATLHGTLMRNANLFGADLLRIKVDAGTDFSGANLERTLAGVRDKR